MKSGYKILAPVEKDKGFEGVVIEEIDDPKQVKFLGRLPLHSFKRFLLASCEVIDVYESTNGATKLRNPSQPPFFKREGKGDFKQALFGLTILDLQALLLQGRMFAEDPYYQARLKNILIIGQSLMPKVRGENFFGIKYKKENLKHLMFDVFLELVRTSPRNMVTAAGFQPMGSSSEGATRNQVTRAVFTGSEKGKKILRAFGLKKFEHIPFVGPSPKVNETYRMSEIKQAMEKNFKPEIWEALAKRCIECGKCTIACPTCFCFRIDDEISPSFNPSHQGREVKGELLQGRGVARGLIARTRCLDSCFYQEFSEVAGGSPKALKGKFLKNTAERIFFWYEHHFVRMPRDVGVPGCVGCGRCFRVCPVFINIKDELSRIMSE